MYSKYCLSCLSLGRTLHYCGTSSNTICMYAVLYCSCIDPVTGIVMSLAAYSTDM